MRQVRWSRDVVTSPKRRVILRKSMPRGAQSPLLQGHWAGRHHADAVINRQIEVAGIDVASNARKSPALRKRSSRYEQQFAAALSRKSVVSTYPSGNDWRSVCGPRLSHAPWNRGGSGRDQPVGSHDEEHRNLHAQDDARQQAADLHRAAYPDAGVTARFTSQSAHAAVLVASSN